MRKSNENGASLDFGSEFKPSNGAPAFEQVFKNIDDVLHKDDGCSTELHYAEQTSWLLFLKYLDTLEQDRATEAQLVGKPYSFILDEPYRWNSWAAPRNGNGKIDHNKALTGDDLRDFVNLKLFPYLQGFKQKANDQPNTIEYKIGEIFSELKNLIKSGYNLRDVIDYIDELRFGTQQEKFELSHLYEAKIKNMGNAGRNGGEYYTPRPLIRAIVKVVNPQVGERIYDGAVGSAGFLCEAFDYMRANSELTTKDMKVLQERTFYGKEKKSLPFIIAIMNMILHGIEAPNIIHTNTLSENLSDIQDKDRYDVVIANPPFGGKERKEVQQNFPIRTGETAFLFLQHFIKVLKPGGRAGVVIKNTFLSNTDNAAVSLRKHLLETCNLHTVLDCPTGTFFGAGVRTVVLFFEKGTSTKSIFYYELDPGRNLGKTRPLDDSDLQEFLSIQETHEATDHSWTCDVSALDKRLFDLSVNNPSKGVVLKQVDTDSTLGELADLHEQEAELFGNLGELPNLDSDLFDFRSDSAVAPLSTFLERTETVNPTHEPDVEFKYVDVSSVSNTTFEIADFQTLLGSAAPSRARKVIRAGDVIFATVRPTLQRVAIVPEHLDGQVCSTGYVVLRPKPSLNSRYLFYYLFSSYFRHQMERLQKGASYPAVTDGEVRSQIIAVPALAVQNEIVAHFDSLITSARELDRIASKKQAAVALLEGAWLDRVYSQKAE